MGGEDVSDEMGGVTNGTVFDLVGLRSSSQSLDQLALMFREFWKISWRFRGGGGAMSLTSSAYSKWSIVRLSDKSLM